MKLIKLLIFLLIAVSANISAQQYPATEIRAVWLTTNWGLDWPRQAGSVTSQKNELRSILDRLEENNINIVLFQARMQGTTMYRSSIEPLNPIFNHSEGFDPLAFAIEECHKRGMECHAWIIAYPDEKVKYSGKGKRRKIVNSKPSYYKEIDGRWYLDPGRPETREHILSITKEIVRNYDVDGVHFDYIRYPSNTRKFPDSDTYQKYGKGQNIYDWRRDNINKLIFDIYDSVKSIKNWVQVSSSPLGRYRVLPHAPNDGWTGYETVFQDAGNWMRSGKHDLVFPMMYYKERLFYPFVEDWVANSGGRYVVPGLGAYQMMSNEQNWSLQNLTDQMTYLRQNKDVKGQAYFRAGNILDNLKGINDSIQAYYPYPAKLPALTWLNNASPNSPVNLEIYKDRNGMLNIKWDAPGNSESYTYTVYVSSSEDIDTNDARNILATGIHNNNIAFPIRTGEFGMYYTVTASDRYHNESVICFPTFFSHSTNEQ